MCEEYVDEVMTSPPHLNERTIWQMVSSRSGTFLNCVATIDGKRIAIRKRFFSSIISPAIVDSDYKFVFFILFFASLILRLVTPGCGHNFRKIRKHAQSCATVCM